MISLNIAAMLYALHGMWNWLSWIAIALGCLTQVLIWFVQCSDPGILHREQDKTKLTALTRMQQASQETGEEEIEWEDELLSLNEFEMRAIT